jgi:hypothetical protein
VRLTAAHPWLAAVTGAAVLTATALVWAREPIAPAPVAGARTALHTIELSPVAVTSALPPAAAATSGGPGSPRTGAIAAVAPRGTAPFSLLGVTWTDPGTELAGTVLVRTRGRADHRWSGWRALDADEPSAADPGTEFGDVRGSTDPLWVGPSDGVEARVLSARGGWARGLPPGARIDLIDPGTDPAPSRTPIAYPERLPPAPPPGTGSTTATTPGATSRPATTRPATTRPATSLPATEPGTLPAAGRAGAPAGRALTLPARPVPRMVTRAGWRADESLNGHDPEYTSDVQALFVHHTAGTNDYPCSDSPKIIRSIHAYHVRSKHWNDIGYNFLVDRCGTLFEGRRGGVGRPVLGAHTMGFNSRSAGIAVLGDYAGRGVSSRVRGVIAQVAAYKIGMSGIGTGGSVTLTSAGSNKYRPGSRVRLNRISGHRDAVSTECPGNTLYRQLGAIRDLADGPVAGLRISRLRGAVRVGDAFATKGPLTVTWGLRTPTAMLSRFEILVDGRLATARPAGGRAAGLRLSPGVHSVRVRAVPLAGATSTSAIWTVVADPEPPEFTRAPAVGLRTGSLDGSVPVTLSWQAADAVGLRSVTLIRPGLRTFGPTITHWATTAAPAIATTWTMRADDRAGNGEEGSVTRTPMVISEAAGARTGSWGQRRSTGYLGGSALLSAQAGASLTWGFTGRSAALAFSRTARSGQVRVFVDGSQTALIDLRSTATAHRRAVFAQSWSTSGAHTVRIVVVGTPGRPTVISDGLVHLR